MTVNLPVSRVITYHASWSLGIRPSGLVTKLQILHQFNDIAREIYVNGAWESWLSDHLVKAMINYPDAVLLGKISVTTHKKKKNTHIIQYHQPLHHDL